MPKRDRSIALEDEMWAFVRHAAKDAGGLSASQVVRWAIDEYKEKHFPEWVYGAGN